MKTLERSQDRKNGFSSDAIKIIIIINKNKKVPFLRNQEQEGGPSDDQNLRSQAKAGHRREAHGWWDGSANKDACHQLSLRPPRTHVVKGENQLPQVVLWPSHMIVCARAHTHQSINQLTRRGENPRKTEWSTESKERGHDTKCLHWQYSSIHVECSHPRPTIFQGTMSKKGQGCWVRP